MPNGPMCKLNIDKQIFIIDKNICDSIDRNGPSERGYLSQVILSQLRTFLEHIMLKIYANGNDIEDTYPNICAAISYVKTKGELRVFWKFHDFLQTVTSHYILDEESSERLMLKYFSYLLKIKSYFQNQFSIEILHNLDKFPFGKNSDMKEYYEKIAAKILQNRIGAQKPLASERFYVSKVKPFFVNNKAFYEVTFTPANEKSSKFDRLIAFTDIEVSPAYAVKLYLTSDSIEILEKTMPILIISKWEVSIRPCEINNFSKLFGYSIDIQTSSSEYKKLMQFLTDSGFNLVEIIDFQDKEFLFLKKQIESPTASINFVDVLEKCRIIIKTKSNGSNVLRYLLFHLSNKVIKDQFYFQSNDRLSKLLLRYGCIPFDKMPFNTSLIGHNPKLSDLFECIDAANRKHELLARLVRNNIEINGILYTPLDGLLGFDNIEDLVSNYNSLLWEGHSDRKLVIDKKRIFISEYENNALEIIKRLQTLAQNGILNYSSSVKSWLNASHYNIDDPEKTDALTKMFEKSQVALVYGSAGTGKSTLIKHISQFFAQKTKLFLAHTNPALDNLKRKVEAPNCTFWTISKFTKKQNIATDFDLLFIDECSTVGNAEMVEIFKKATFKLLILVGDVYQIESIRFGNWFGIAKNFIPATSVFELTNPWRSTDASLLELWKRVRNMDDNVLEILAKRKYSVTLDTSIFEPADTDEIILCLNYDGLYGINNINRFLQQSNPNPAFQRGLQIFKVGDPILFNETERFAPLIYNNMKGSIVDIKVLTNQMQFDIRLDKVINGMDASGFDFELLNTPAGENSIIRFIVSNEKSTDQDDDNSSISIIPFQVAYAVSIHKAQGLEYRSVKVVISDEIDEMITHNIFYTAITRAREKLKIFWTPEIEKKVLERIKPENHDADAAILKVKMIA